MRMMSLPAVIGVLAFALAGCSGPSEGGGGGGGSSDPGLPSVPLVPTDPADEVPPGGGYAALSDRGAAGTADMIYVVLEGTTARINDGVTATYGSGAVAGGLLDGTDLDGSQYTNPANAEFSRIVRISGSNVFGAVGVDVMPGDLPVMGTTTSYNEGWVGMIAILEDGVYVLEGDAIFTATWGTNDLDGRFVNLSGTDPQDQTVTRVGNIDLDNASISGDQFSGGTVTGTGIFAPLNAASGAQGAFFGPDADEIGGVLSIDDSGADIRVVGAFHAD